MRDVDIHTFRERLALFRRHGLDFDQAWHRAIDGVTDEWSTPIRWARQHFEAAYNGQPVKLGLFRVARPDTAQIVQRERPAPTLCRSGDRCARENGHGQFGSFCAQHAAELKPLRGCGNEAWRNG